MPIWNEDKLVTEIDEKGISQCFMCERDRLDGTCEAYPDGIPVEILKNEIDHLEPYKNDQGLTFVAVETSD